MNEDKKCPKCGATVAAEWKHELCPACLIKAGMESGVTDSSPSPQANDATRTGGGPFVPLPSTPPAIDEVRKLFPQLEILEQIGRGGMGIVYKARQPRLDRVVALKILSVGPGSSGAYSGFAERFAREARALAKLNHPNIVSVFDFGQAGDHFYLIMEFVDGANLRQMIAAKQITPETALTIVPKVCEALQFAHDEGILHRDIKPENILIDKKGRVKIADFGLAKLIGDDTVDHSLTGTQQIMGTPRYMAPEQFENTKTVDHRADIYSLGVVFYEMLTGEIPMGRFALPSQKVQVDVRIDEVVLRSLEREPAQRYQHVSEVKTDVENVTHHGVMAASPSLPKRDGEPPSLHALPAVAPELRAKISSAGILMFIAGISVALSGLIAFIYGAAMAFHFATQTGNTGDAAARAAGGAFGMVALTLCGIAAIVGGQAMRKLRFRGFALGMSVLLMALLPMTFAMVGRMSQAEWIFIQNAFALYAGIKCFRLLRKPEVEAAFAAVAQQPVPQLPPYSPQAKFIRSVLWLVVVIGTVMFCWFEKMTIHGSNGYSVLRVGAVTPWLILGRDTPTGNYVTPNFATVSALAGICGLIALFSLNATKRRAGPAVPTTGTSRNAIFQSLERSRGCGLLAILGGAAAVLGGFILFSVAADRAIASGIMDYERADRPAIKTAALNSATLATGIFLAGAGAICAGLYLRRARGTDKAPACWNACIFATGGIASSVMLFYGISAQVLHGTSRIDFLALPLVLFTVAAAVVQLIRNSATGRPASADAVPELALVVLGCLSAAMPWDSFAITSGNPWDVVGSGWRTNAGSLVSFIYLVLALALLVTGGRGNRPAWRPVLLLVAGLVSAVVAYRFAAHPIPHQLGWTLPNGLKPVYHLQTGWFVSAAIALLTIIVGAIQLRNRTVATDDAEPAAKSSDEPRLGRCALVGVLWAPFTLLGWPVWQMCIRQFFDNPKIFATFTPAYQFIGIILGLLAATAWLGSTLLGGLAIGHIKRSGGKIYGLPLAATSFLAHPIAVLGAGAFGLTHLIQIALWTKVHTSYNSDAAGNLVNPRAPTPHSYPGMDFMILDSIVAVIVIVLVAFLAWRRIAGHETPAVDPRTSVKRAAVAVLVGSIASAIMTLVMMFATYANFDARHFTLVGAIFRFIALVGFGLLAFFSFTGSLKMMNCGDRRASRRAALCSLVSLFGIISLPAGIYALIVLGRPEVKNLFASAEVPTAGTSGGANFQSLEKPLDHRVAEAVTKGIPGWFNARAKWVQSLVQTLLMVVFLVGFFAFVSFNMKASAGPGFSSKTITIGNPSPWLEIVKDGGNFRSVIHPASSSALLALLGATAMVIYERIRRSRPGFDAAKDRRSTRIALVMLGVVFAVFITLAALLTVRKPGQALRQAVITEDASSGKGAASGVHRMFRYNVSAPLNHRVSFWVEYWRDGKLDEKAGLTGGFQNQFPRGAAFEGGYEFSLADGAKTSPEAPGKLRWDIFEFSRLRNHSSTSSDGVTVKTRKDDSRRGYGNWIADPFAGLDVVSSWGKAGKWNVASGKPVTLLVLRGYATGENLAAGLRDDEAKQSSACILLKVRIDAVPPSEQVEHNQTQTLSAADVEKLNVSARPPETTRVEKP